MRRTNLRARGFTLIELLLATGLIATIMLMSYAGLEAAIKMADAGDAHIERSSRVRVTHEFLRRQLGRMLPLNISADPTKSLSFIGKSNVVQWVSSMPGYLGRGGLYVQELSIDGEVMNYRFAMFNGYKEGDLSVDEPIALIEGLRSAEFAFRTIDNSGKLTDWSGNFSSDNGPPIPLMVRVKVDMKPETRLSIPELVVPVVVDANVGRALMVLPGEIR
jgi:general secretion pathway protein J